MENYEKIISDITSNYPETLMFSIAIFDVLESENINNDLNNIVINEFLDINNYCLEAAVRILKASKNYFVNIKSFINICSNINDLFMEKNEYNFFKNIFLDLFGALLINNDYEKAYRLMIIYYNKFNEDVETIYLAKILFLTREMEIETDKREIFDKIKLEELEKYINLINRN